MPGHWCGLSMEFQAGSCSSMAQNSTVGAWASGQPSSRSRSAIRSGGQYKYFKAPLLLAMVRSLVSAVSQRGTPSTVRFGPVPMAASR